MTTGWWELKKDLEPTKCLVFPKMRDTEYNSDDLTDDGEIDLELFDDIVKSTIKLTDCDREMIVTLIKSGYTSGQVVH